MRVLLDTSYLHDPMEAPKKLLDTERQFFTRQEMRIHVGAVSIWEMRLKFGARHPSSARKSLFDTNDVVAVLDGQDVIFMPMTMNHMARAFDMPLGHKDPFDELLLIQAQGEGLSFFIADQRLAGHSLATTVNGSA